MIWRWEKLYFPAGVLESLHIPTKENVGFLSSAVPWCDKACQPRLQPRVSIVAPSHVRACHCPARPCSSRLRFRAYPDTDESELSLGTRRVVYSGAARGGRSHGPCNAGVRGAPSPEQTAE
jgi:hypothetical protein